MDNNSNELTSRIYDELKRVLGVHFANVRNERGISLRDLSSQTGIEYVVKLDNGQVISITQGTQGALSVGQRCLVLFGNPSRIIPQ